MRILRDGRIEVGFSEDGMLTALFEEGKGDVHRIVTISLRYYSRNCLRAFLRDSIGRSRISLHCLRRGF